MTMTLSILNLLSKIKQNLHTKPGSGDSPLTLPLSLFPRKFLLLPRRTAVSENGIGFQLVGVVTQIQPTLAAGS